MTDEGPESDHQFDDVHWADPAIRKNYEAALGRLILAHNDADLQLTRLIEKCIEQLGDKPELAKLASGTFDRRLANTRMLSAILPDLKVLEGIAFDELAELNGFRNIVAHGHFEQNPFQGEYELITRTKRHDNFSTERLNGITARLEKQAEALKVSVWFCDLEDLENEPD